MLCRTSRLDQRGKVFALSRQSAGGAPTAEGRAARAAGNLHSTRGGTTGLPLSEPIRFETLDAWLGAEFVFMHEGLTFDMRGD